MGLENAFLKMKEVIGMDQQSRRKCVLVNKLKDDG